MGKQEPSRQPSSESPSTGPSRSGGKDGGRSRRAPGGPGRDWWSRNRRDVRFLLIFFACIAAYYLLTLTPPVKSGFFPAYLRFNASICAAVLRAVGMDVTAADKTLISAGGASIQVERGCDAVDPSALFVSAVLASPVPLLSRLLAAAAGTVLLMLLNFVRVISLFLVRLYWPAAFETVHLDVWQALFILLAVLLWMAWASRAAPRERQRASVPA